MLNANLPATATTFAISVMPVINFDLSYTYLGKYLGQWAPTIFSQTLEDKTVLSMNLRAFGYTS
jgi:hypothetical protein